jgi:hypothetical protein
MDATTIGAAFERSPQFTRGFHDYSIHFEAERWWVAQDGLNDEIFVYLAISSEVDGFIFEKA